MARPPVSLGPLGRRSLSSLPGTTAPPLGAGQERRRAYGGEHRWRCSSGPGPKTTTTSSSRRARQELAKARLPEGLGGDRALHALVAEHLTTADVDPVTGHLAAIGSSVGIETGPRHLGRSTPRRYTATPEPDADRPLPRAVLHPELQSDAVRRRGPGLVRDVSTTAVGRDAPTWSGVKIATRAHQSLIWDRTGTAAAALDMLAFYPAALQAFGEAVSSWVRRSLELLAGCAGPSQPRPCPARRSLRCCAGPGDGSGGQGRGDPGRACGLRRASTDRVQRHAASVSARLLPSRCGPDRCWAGGGGVWIRHPAAEIYLSRPGLGPVLGARMWPTSADAPGRSRRAGAEELGTPRHPAFWVSLERPGPCP